MPDADHQPRSSSIDRDVDREVEQLRKEILRLRDALIGKEAELGEALGRVAEADALVAQAAAERQRLREILASRSWRVMWALGRPLRAMRSPHPE